MDPSWEWISKTWWDSEVRYVDAHLKPPHASAIFPLLYRQRPVETYHGLVAHMSAVKSTHFWVDLRGWCFLLVMICQSVKKPKNDIKKTSIATKALPSLPKGFQSVSSVLGSTQNKKLFQMSFRTWPPMTSHPRGGTVLSFWKRIIKATQKRFSQLNPGLSTRIHGI